MISEFLYGCAVSDILIVACASFLFGLAIGSLLVWILSSDDIYSYRPVQKFTVPMGERKPGTLTQEEEFVEATRRG